MTTAMLCAESPAGQAARRERKRVLPSLLLKNLLSSLLFCIITWLSANVLSLARFPSLALFAVRVAVRVDGC